MISIGQVKLSYLPAKLCAFGPKMKRMLKILKKILRFFDQNLYGKLTFSQFFTKYFLDFWLRSESIDLWKITPDFYNNFSGFGGGERSGVPPPPPDATGYLKRFAERVQKQVFQDISFSTKNTYMMGSFYWGTIGNMGFHLANTKQIHTFIGNKYS